MKIFNWNFSMLNRKVKESIDFALSQEADVYCFQEMNREGLDYLKKFDSYHMAHLSEYYKNGRDYGFLVTLSKYPIVKENVSKYCLDRKNSFWERSRVFNRFLEIYTKDKESLSVEVDTEIGIKKIHNLHLTWAVGPTKRLNQFKNFLNQNNPNSQDLICGDLNIIDNHLYIYDLVAYFILGYKREDLFFKERKAFDEIFKEKNFQNPFSNNKSCPIMFGHHQTQLDHILVPQDFEIIYTSDFKKTFGSDHRPQMIEILKKTL